MVFTLPGYNLAGKEYFFIFDKEGQKWKLRKLKNLTK